MQSTYGEFGLYGPTFLALSDYVQAKSINYAGGPLKVNSVVNRLVRPFCDSSTKQVSDSRWIWEVLREGMDTTIYGGFSSLVKRSLQSSADLTKGPTSRYRIRIFFMP